MGKPSGKQARGHAEEDDDDNSESETDDSDFDNPAAAARGRRPRRKGGKSRNSKAVSQRHVVVPGTPEQQERYRERVPIPAAPGDVLRLFIRALDVLIEASIACNDDARVTKMLRGIRELAAAGKAIDYTSSEMPSFEAVQGCIQVTGKTTMLDWGRKMAAFFLLRVHGVASVKLHLGLGYGRTGGCVQMKCLGKMADPHRAVTALEAIMNSKVIAGCAGCSADHVICSFFGSPVGPKLGSGQYLWSQHAGDGEPPPLDPTYAGYNRLDVAVNCARRLLNDPGFERQCNMAGLTDGLAVPARSGARPAMIVQTLDRIARDATDAEFLVEVSIFLFALAKAMDSQEEVKTGTATEEGARGTAPAVGETKAASTRAARHRALCDFAVTAARNALALGNPRPGEPGRDDKRK